MIIFLFHQMMLRRDELTFRQEMKFRNKLVEYLTDWIMGNSHQLNVQGDVCLVSRFERVFFTSAAFLILQFCEVTLSCVTGA
jgi:neurofibromin 1